MIVLFALLRVEGEPNAEMDDYNWLQAFSARQID
jgi:hypothetical protein